MNIQTQVLPHIPPQGKQTDIANCHVFWYVQVSTEGSIETCKSRNPGVDQRNSEHRRESDVRAEEVVSCNIYACLLIATASRTDVASTVCLTTTVFLGTSPPKQFASDEQYVSRNLLFRCRRQVTESAKSAMPVVATTHESSINQLRENTTLAGWALSLWPPEGPSAGAAAAADRESLRLPVLTSFHCQTEGDYLFLVLA